MSLCLLTKIECGNCKFFRPYGSKRMLIGTRRTEGKADKHAVIEKTKSPIKMKFELA